MLVCSQEAKQAELAKLDFATWTWTKGGSNHEDTINERKIKLGSWLNAVLFLCRALRTLYFIVVWVTCRSRMPDGWRCVLCPTANS